MIDNLKLIKETVAKAKTLPNCKIEYNFNELPKEVKEDNFFGIEAIKNPKRTLNTINIVYKYGN